MKKETLSRLAAYLSIYLLVIARWGYEYGRNDQMQILGYAKYLANKSLFSLDNYIQGMAEKVPNERFAIAWILSWSGSLMEVVAFIGHLVVTVLMFHLLYKMAKNFIKTDYLVWLALLVIFVPLYGINLGGNELYCNSLFVSNVVKLVGLWGVFLFLKEKIVPAFFVIGMATLLQPVVGVQLFVTLAGILFCTKVLKKSNFSWGRIFQGILAFVLTGGLWVIFLKLFFEEDAAITNGEFFNILFKFRAPHHYLPSAFGLTNYLILMPLFLFGLWYYLKKEGRIAWFFGISFGLMAFYTIMVEGFSNVNAASLQWFKITIWLEAFSVIAVFAFLEDRLPFVKNQILRKLALPVLSLTGLCVFVILTFWRSLFFWDVPFDFGNQRQTDPAAAICTMAKFDTPQDALFIHPIGFTELKVYGERSSFVEYKIMVHRKNAMKKWYNRLGLLYGVGTANGKQGFSIYEDGDNNFKALDTIRLKRLNREFGITHILTWQDHHLELPQVAENEKFRIYKIE